MAVISSIDGGAHQVWGSYGVELRDLSAFVAVTEDGGMSAASRRLHISQPALSHTIRALEQELGVQLLERRSTGVVPTEAGTTLLGEARAILARYHQALRTMASYTTEGTGVIRLGIPLELAADILPRVLKKLAATDPHARVIPRHLSTAAQVIALRGNELDVGLVRERPAGSEFDALLVARENLGVLLASELAAGLIGAQGIRLDALGGLQWVGFPGSDSPAWYDELTAILRSHGVDVGPPAPDDQALIAPVKYTAVSAGRAFALAPENWSHAIPDNVTWSPLVDHPLVRRTWAVWPANSRRRDIGHLVAAFEIPESS